MTQPVFRAIWKRGRGWVFTCGRADYYGWRWWVGIGPLTLLIGRATP